MSERIQNFESDPGSPGAAELYRAAYNLMLKLRRSDGRADHEDEEENRLGGIVSRCMGLVPRSELPAIIQKARYDAYYLPESMFLSEEAMRKFEEMTAGYQYFDCTSNNVAEICKPFTRQNQFSYMKSYSTTGHAIPFIIAAADNQIIGRTMYKNVGSGMVHVDHQEALKEYPGAGLGMLQRLVNNSRAQGKNGIYLHTYMTPMGLGNLGFEPYTDPNSPEMPYYQLILREGAAGLSSVLPDQELPE